MSRTIPILKNTVEAGSEGLPGRGTSPRRALVTGATGVLGPMLARALGEQGWSVRALCRTTPAPGLLPGSVEIHIGDIVSGDQVARAAEGVTAVFHLAGLLHNPRPDPEDASLYESINVGGTRNVARAAAAQAASVIHFSTIAVYGATSGPPVDEDRPTRPVGLYATSKQRAEDALLEAGLHASVLRLAAVYGRRMKGNYPRLVDALRRGRFVPIGDGSNRRTLVHETDAVRAALMVADATDGPSRIFNVTDGATHAMTDIVRAICSALGRSEPRLRVPETFARLGARTLGQGDVVDKYLENVEVSGQRIQKTLGFKPEFDLATGWRDAIRGMEAR